MPFSLTAPLPWPCRAAFVRALCLCVCLGIPSIAPAAMAPLLSDYSHTAWGPQQGAPNDVLSFAQTTDGWLWLASSNGLYRFDGARFERMDSVQGQRLHSTNVLGLLATPDGALWIGHRFGGISHVKDGRLRLHKGGEGLSAGGVFGIVPGPDGAIWAATTQGLGHLAPGAERFVTVGGESGLPRRLIYKVLFTRDGRQWVATEGGLYYREPGQQRYRRSWPDLPMAMIEEAPDGTLWASDGNDKHYRVRSAPPPGNPAPQAIAGGTGMHFDRDGVMWVLKRQALERRVAPYLGHPLGHPLGHADGAAQQLGRINGISGPLPQVWFQDREGNIWIGTSAGVDRLRRNRVHSLTLEATLDHPSVVADAGGRVLVGDAVGKLRSADAAGVREVVAPMSLSASYRAPDGAIWIGDEKARWRRGADGAWTRLPHPPALSGHSTHAMLLGGDGRMWVALQALGLFRVDGDQWRPSGDLPELPRALALALAGEAGGRVWAGYVGSRIARIDGDRVRVYGEADGVRLGNVQSLLVDGARVWAGGEYGVAYFEHDRWVALAAPLRGVSGMARTPGGELWLHGAEGITRIGAGEVEALLRDPGRTPVLERFDALDGLRGSAEQLRPIPTLTQGTDGRLWFTTASEVASIDPRAIPRNRLAPPVQITVLRADGRRIEQTYGGARIILPTGSGELQIAYTALSLSMPERVRFRYRLHGVDTGWRDAGTRREAFYTNLAPGYYRFEVSAANEDGLWNSTGAQMHITIPPRFVQTRVFVALMAALAALALYCAYRLRVRHLTRRMDDLLHARLAERARIARGLHDTLLQSVQSLIMFFDKQARRLPHDAEERRKIEQTLRLADQLMGESRDYIGELRAARAPQELGEALREYGSVLLHERLAVSIVGKPRALAPLVRDELHAIAREALFNCARHANASQVELVLDYGRDSLSILVRDDGCGTACERAGHYGLSGMRERAQAIGATCTLSSRPGSGTSVHLAIGAGRAYAGMATTTALARLRQRLPFSKAA